MRVFDVLEQVLVDLGKESPELNTFSSVRLEGPAIPVPLQGLTPMAIVAVQEFERLKQGPDTPEGTRWR